jgi:Leucine-rich repeat (LRR) protein
MSLWSLMLFVLVAGGGLGWFALQRQREVRRQRVIATIQASGSSVELVGADISQILWLGGSANPASLPQRPLTPEQIDALGACNRLRELVMVTAVMTDQGLAGLANDRMLERVYCFKPCITDTGVNHLANLTSLKKLELLRAPELTDATLVHIAGLTNLEEITLSGTSITGSGLVHVARMRKLRSLTIPNSALDDAGLAYLGRLTSLQKLYIGGGKYTDTGLTKLSGLINLTEIGIGSDGCTDAGIANLSTLANLQILSVVGPQITDSWLDRMAGMKSLRHLEIGGDQVSEEAIAKLHRSLPGITIHIDGQPR